MKENQKMTQRRFMVSALLFVFLGMTLHCSSDDDSGGSPPGLGGEASTGELITTAAVAALWAPYQTATATCVEAVKVAIGESGKTTTVPGSSQKACDGACIDPKASNPSGATGIWQVKCPDPSYTLIYNAFVSAGLIVNGACVDLTDQQNNAQATSLVVEVACPGQDFCASQWTGGASYYDQFTEAATAACPAASD